MRFILIFSTLAKPLLHSPAGITIYPLKSGVNSGTAMDKALLIRKLEEHFGGSLITLRINECARIICFQKYLPETLKLVEANDNDEITEPAKKISAEIKTDYQKLGQNYHLRNFKLEKVKENTNESLLYFISRLVSKVLEPNT